jgi:hypothetical protein
VAVATMEEGASAGLGSFIAVPFSACMTHFQWWSSDWALSAKSANYMPLKNCPLYCISNFSKSPYPIFRQPQP